MQMTSDNMFRGEHREYLWPFVLLSLALHIAFLLQKPSTPDLGLPSLASALEVRIVAARDEKPRTQTQEEKSQPRSETPKLASSETKSEEPRTAPVADMAATPAPHEQASPVTNTTDTPAQTAPLPSTADIVYAVKGRLTQYFSYPMLARRKGWEGEVLLGFSVDSEGWLRAAHIARSSGYPLLDRSALEALLKVQRLELAPESALELQIPVIYRLREG